MKKFILLTVMVLSVVMTAFAQDLKISGTVTDETGEPIIGVSVSVVNHAGLGTNTDLDGAFTIKAPQFSKLVFQYVGYDKQEVLIKDATPLKIVLKESSESVLDEVVVTAVGAQKKVNVTGAITTVDLGDIKRTNPTNLSNALAGNVAGVMAMQTSGQPGKNISEFWIRGISTFGASSSAYVLVDGFERKLDEVNIEDIESISVLKDASATAIYGSKGANGVVLITTKHGKEGKININVKLQSSYNTRTKTPEFVDGVSYANLINEANVTRNRAAVYSPAELEILRLGLDPDLYPNVDWKGKLLRDGAFNYRANVDLSGGGSTARYFVSVGYLNENGMYNTDETLRKDYNTNANYHRWNYRLNTDIDITRTTLLKVGVAGSLDKRNSPGLGDGDVWGELFGYTPIATPIMYSNGRFPAVGTGNKTNPWVAATQTGYNENWNNSVQTNVSLEQNLDFITPGLRFVGRFGFDINNSNYINRRRWPEQWKAERKRDANGDIVWTKISDPSDMFQESGSSGNRREFLDAMLSWNRSLKENNLGATIKFTQDSYINTQNIGTDLKNGVSQRNMSLAGQVTYNWRHRYYLDFNFGYTGSENFATGHQFGFFPAFSLAWNIASEDFIAKNCDWLNMFKVRFSWGRVGNDRMGTRFPFLYTIGTTEGTAYQWANTGYNRSYVGKHYTQVASPYVTWEIATKKDLGIDLALFHDKLTATIDYFDEGREGIYMARNFLPQITGLESTPSANVGAVKTRGFDGHFAYRQRLGDVNLTVRGNFTYSKNEITAYDEENNVYAYQQTKGYRVDQIRGLISEGLFKDYDDIRNSPKQQFGEYQPGDIKYKDVNGDGVVNGGDRVAIGATSRPNLIYGFGVSAAWKGIDVNLHFQGAGKVNLMLTGKCVYAFSEGEWGNIIEGLVEDRWVSRDISGTPATENINAPYPRLSYNGNSNNQQESTFWLRDMRYLRLKNVDIGYTIPQHLTQKMHINNIRVFMTGTNLLTFSPFKLWDPELANPRGEAYPLTRAFTLGLTINL